MDSFRWHGPVTDPGPMRHLLAGLPADPAALATIIGGVLVHRDWAARFGFVLPEERRAEANTRDVAAILARLGTLDARDPEARLAVTCRDFAVLLCAMLREAGVLARVRAGFAGYFVDGFFSDHWVTEVWDGARWHLVDAQVASAAPGTYIDAALDPLDVPRDGFLVGGQAWQECRSGARDPGSFGIAGTDLTGMWEVQGNVLRDLACLNRVEPLPWDDYGLIPVHYDDLSPEDVSLLDRLAAAGAAASRFTEAYRSDPRVAVPAAA